MSGTATRPTNIINSVIQEIGQRESRGRNLIFSGKTGKNKVEKFLEKAGVSAAEKIVELGKEDKKVLLVVMASEAEKWRALSKAKPLCTTISEFDGMYVNRDLTRAEREAEFQLRQEVRRRRTNGESVMIKKGKVVNK